VVGPVVVSKEYVPSVSSDVGTLSSATLELTPQNPVPLSLIIPSLLEEILAHSDATDRLANLFCDDRFQYKAGKTNLFTFLFELEQQAFDQVKDNGGSLSPLLPFINHSAVVFIEKHVGSLDQSVRESWVSLMADELRFAFEEILATSAKDELLSNEYKLLIVHAVSIVAAIKDVSVEVSTSEPFLAVQKCVSQLLEHSEDLFFSEPPSSEDAQCLHYLLSLANSFADSRLPGHLRVIYHSVHDVCRRLTPDDFDLDDESISDDSNQELEDGDLQTQSRPNIEVYDQSLYGNSAYSESLADCEDSWADLHQHCLTLGVSGALPLREASFWITILDSTPSTMPNWSTALQGLANCSEEALKSFMPRLLSRSAEDDLAAICLLDLLTVSSLTPNPLVYSSLHVAQDGFNHMTFRDRLNVLDRMNDAVIGGCEMLNDTASAKKILSELETDFWNDSVALASMDLSMFVEVLKGIITCSRRNQFAARSVLDFLTLAKNPDMDKLNFNGSVMEQMNALGRKKLLGISRTMKLALQNEPNQFLDVNDAQENYHSFCLRFKLPLESANSDSDLAEDS
jgi:hypothetical protein